MCWRAKWTKNTMQVSVIVQMVIIRCRAIQRFGRIEWCPIKKVAVAKIVLFSNGVSDFKWHELLLHRAQVQVCFSCTRKAML